MLSTRWIVMGCLLMIATGVASAQTRFYVAPQGRDVGWSGRRSAPNRSRTDGPFATPDGALMALAAYAAAHNGLPQNTRLVVAAGTYETAGIRVSSKGMDGLTIEAAVGSAPRITGGKSVHGFTLVTDPRILARLDPAAAGHVLQADLKPQSISDPGTMRPQGFSAPITPLAAQLYLNGLPMQIARWPNSGFEHIADTPKGANGGMFTYSGDRPARWTNAEDAWLFGYWTFDWADTYVKIKSIDAQNHALYMAEPHGAFGYKKDQRFYALNLLEELDTPGEYYTDRGTGILYFWPPVGSTTAGAELSMAERPLLSIEGASHITVRGLLFECGRGNGIVIHADSLNCRLEGLEIRNIGNVGVRVEGGANNEVVACRVYQCGEGGMQIEGGDRKTLTPCGNRAVGNTVHDYSTWARTYRPGIGVTGVGITVSGNTLYNGPHTAILLGGNDNIIEYNNIHDVCRETGDVGAFYMGRDWTMRGNVIRYNYFHQIGGFHGNGFTDAMGVYLDDAASGSTVYGNVFHQSGRAVLVGGGRDNLVENNLFIDCSPSVHVDARCTGWAKGQAAPGGDWQMSDKLAAVHYNQPPYSTRYPALATMMEDEPMMPKGTAVSGNTCFGGTWLSLQDGLTDKILKITDNQVEPNLAAAPSAEAVWRRAVAAAKRGTPPLLRDLLSPGK